MATTTTSTTTKTETPIVRKRTPRQRICLITFILAASNYISFSLGFYKSFFSQYLTVVNSSAVDTSSSSATVTTSSLRGAIAEDGDGTPIAAATAVARQSSLSKPPKQKFTQPSPHLWSTTPIVPPHTGHKKVLVTGAAGFIGSHVAHALLDRGDEVIIVDEMNDYYDVRVKENNLKLLREKADQIAPGKGKDVLTIYNGDINNQTLMHRIFQHHHPLPWVCHLAARAGVRPSIQDPLLYVQANVRGTTSMLQYSKDYNVINTVVASSSSVYGESDSTYFSEAEDVNMPVSPYASTKRAGELISYTYHHLYGLNVTNLRFFTVYGPRGRPDMAPYKFIDRIRRGVEIQKFGNGSTSRDYTYVSDIVDGVLRSIDRTYAYEIINLGKGKGTTLDEFIGLVERYVGRKANVRVLEEQMGDVPFTNADVSKAERLLGYESRVTFEEGIRRTVGWFNETFGE